MFYSDPLYANTLVEAMEYLCLQNNFTCSVNIQPFPSQHAPCGIQILRQHLLCLLPSKALYESALRLPGPSFQKMIPGSVGSAALYLTTAIHAQFIPFSRERLRRVLCKKAAVIDIFTPSHLLIYIFTPSHLLIYIFTLSHLLIYIFTPSHLHTFTPADLHLHTLTSTDLHLHTFTSADLHLHTFTSADLHLHTLTPADLHLHLHITLTSADLHLHTFASADLNLHTFTSADPLSLFLLAVPPERHETQPFRTKWTLDVKN